MAVASNPAMRYWILFRFFPLFLVGVLPLDAPSFQIKGACLCLALTALNRPIKLLNNFFYWFCSVTSHHIHVISFLSRALRCFCMSFCFGAFELGIILSRFLSQAVPLSDFPFCFGEASYHTRNINVFFSTGWSPVSTLFEERDALIWTLMGQCTRYMYTWIIGHYNILFIDVKGICWLFFHQKLNFSLFSCS